ncbi:M24 family metallopeptidase [Desulforhopalus singaporensis]|uniref:Xaa-Pro dipeptidase n=1 Tax=Desulforhopalus singaporensis TaxID=91360 RepID=A0A1H0QXG5_9BACT|nr:Xaa-Pro peptidase family protein [Desulforhopalus singaporensis]SDP21835.1 Xaa-Pro dipeptidase [Desulforhopalus singaporensis]
MFGARIENLKRNMVKQEVDVLALNGGPTLSYFTGLHFHLMERPVVLLLPVDNDPVIILPELELAKLEDLPVFADVFSYGENPDTWYGVAADAMTSLAGKKKKIAVEPVWLRFLEYELLRRGCPEAEFIDGSGLVARLRSIKDGGELAHMRKAVRIAEDALEATLGSVREGVKEEEVASELFLQLLRHGSEPDLPFSPIVSSGPNGANPHARPSERKLCRGDLLVIDWGARYNGYVSDLTRTFGIGELDSETEQVYQLVKSANEAGRNAGGPGVACSAVDRGARNVIETGGYGRFFSHRTGHGLGLECHEPPFIRGDNMEVLRPGMTYTVEPGIYLAGRNGVRIEDDVVVTQSGVESLSTMSRELRYL